MFRLHPCTNTLLYPLVVRGYRAEDPVEEEEGPREEERRAPTELVRQFPPEQGAQHHPDKHDRRQQSLGK